MQNLQHQPSSPGRKRKASPIGKQSSAKKRTKAQPASLINEVVASLKDLERILDAKPKLKAVRSCRNALKGLIRTRWGTDISKRHEQSAAVTYEKDLDGLLDQIGQLEARVKEHEEAERELLPDSAKIGDWLGVFKRAPRR
ncbi:MAG: hypothetical protein H0U23_02160 [Blastocatellia bacterium]|nr:hypothetical protein [Blastocatellia bacterium]